MPRVSAPPVRYVLLLALILAACILFSSSFFSSSVRSGYWTAQSSNFQKSRRPLVTSSNLSATSKLPSEQKSTEIPAESSVYPPWIWPSNNSLNPEPCEAAWGQGFTISTSLFGQPPSSRVNFKVRESQHQKQKWTDANVSSWLRCLSNPTLMTSICEGHGLALNPELVAMANGGEDLDTVIGRREHVEMPHLTAGSFHLVRTPETATWQVSEATVQQLYPPNRNVGPDVGIWATGLLSMKTIPEIRCSTVLTGTTFMAVRFEYVNVYHTNTDWHVAFLASKVLDLQSKPRIVFLDGHCKGNLDPVWSSLFSEVLFAKHLIGPVCFEHLVFLPVGYTSPIFQTHKSYIPRCEAGFKQKPPSSPNYTPRSLEYSDWFLDKLGIKGTNFGALFLNQDLRKSNLNVKRILFVRRENYFAHPRSQSGPSDRMSNEEGVFMDLCHWAARRAGVSCEELQKEEEETRDLALVAGSEGNVAIRPTHRKILDIDLLKRNRLSEMRAKFISRKKLILERNLTESQVDVKTKVYVVHGRLTQWPIIQQLKMAYMTDVWVGAHGAGLTHLQFCKPGSHVIEINNRDTQYYLMAEARGISHHQVSESSDDIINLLESILGN